MLLALILASTTMDVAAGLPPAAVVVPTAPMGTRSARPLVAGFALSAKAVGSMLETPLGLLAADVSGALALTNSIDVFGGARMSLATLTQSPQTNLIPYLGARYGGSFNGHTFFGIELAVSAAFALPRLNGVTWVIEPAALVTFTPKPWLEITAGLHGMSVPQTTLWGVGPGFGSAFRVASAWSLLIEMKTLLTHTTSNTLTVAPTLALGAAFH